MQRARSFGVVGTALFLGASGVAQTTVRVSVDSFGNQSNSHAQMASLSGDGRFVAFVSFASNLVPGDTNGVNDVFVHDRLTGATERVSVDSSGNQSNGSTYGSTEPSISEDGRHVAFWSTATNLVPGDTNGVFDVFVHDRLTGSTVCASVDSYGNQGNYYSWVPSISADGRYVAFHSSANNLVQGDTNGTIDVFIHDMQTGATELVSIDSSGNQANGQSHAPSVSGDGRYVAFESEATNLVSGDTNDFEDAFVHDRLTGLTARVSVDSQGNQAEGESGDPFISSDGRWVVFGSSARDLVPGDTNKTYDVFVHDRMTAATELVSVDSSGNQGNKMSWDASVSGDGRYVVFESEANNLVLGDTNDIYDVFVRDRVTGATELASVDSSGNQGNNHAQFAAISGDGHLVGFDSKADNLVPGDTNGAYDVFVHDRATGPVAYCTAGTSASGCQASIAASGTASASAASAFVLSASGSEGGQDGQFFFGTSGRQANPWGNGTSLQCVVPPVVRCGLLVGSGSAGACDGTFSQDLNALWCASCPKPAKNPGAGAIVQAQLWYQDPSNTSSQQSSLSDALEFGVGP